MPREEVHMWSTGGSLSLMWVNVIITRGVVESLVRGRNWMSNYLCFVIVLRKKYIKIKIKI
jgi:hypothetical protein